MYSLAFYKEIINEKITIFFLVLVIVLTFVSCSNNKDSDENKEPVIEYNYSMIKTHPSSSAGMSMPYDIEDLINWSEGFIEFVVLSEPEEITFEYVNQGMIDDAIEQNYSEEDMEIIYKDAIRDMTFPRISIKIENVFYEKEGISLDEYDEMWLTVDALKYSESFVPGARFAAFVGIVDDPYSPIELNIDSYIYYINESEKLIPFTDDPSLMQYKDNSVEKMTELTLKAEATVKARLEAE